MLFEASYHSKETKEAIDTLVGKPFGLLKRLQMRGVGSQRLTVVEGDEEINKLIQRQNTQPFTNIELRPRGIMLWFRVRLDNYVLALPFHKLSVYKSNNNLNIYSENWKLTLTPAYNARMDKKFVRKLMNLKVHALENLHFH